VLLTRTEAILKSIVEQYIVRQAPVPSQGVLAHCGLGVSPATVRNEMARLEEEGYITRPHPSAGGVPSDKGYRYYVESLSGLELPLAEQRLITHLFHQVETEIDEWLRLAAAIIVRMAQNVAVVTGPKPLGCRFKRLELVALQETLALVVLVLYGARIRQQLIAFDQALTQAELSATVTRLNDTFSDLTRPQIQAKAINLSPVEKQIADDVLKMMQAEDEQQYDEPYLDGLHLIVDQPEFAHAHRLQGLMQAVEHRNLLRAIIPPQLHAQEVMVVIGKENEAEAIHDCSVVISQYGLRDEVIGAVGVVGPTRMPYARAIPVVSYLSLVLSQLVAELYGRKYEGVETNDTARRRTDQPA
jgi:heat-inducible transcriptional repressor